MAAPIFKGHVVEVQGKVFTCEHEDYGEWFRTVGAALGYWDNLPNHEDIMPRVGEMGGEGDRYRLAENMWKLVPNRGDAAAFRDFVEVLRWLRRTEEYTSTCVFVVEPDGHCWVWPSNTFYDPHQHAFKNYAQKHNAVAYDMLTLFEVKSPAQTV